MKSILEELFYGNIDPNTSAFERNSTYARAIERISNNEEKLIKLLDEPAKSMFMDFSNAQMEVNALSAQEKFNAGFKLGALLMIEVLTDHSDLFFEK